ncbi:type II toxin-antitoxin system RelE/ParE family toxin [Salsipaludibacter albus]|uniref:type II toxin-antitoxin system RelE/ParE family toxin n=1 Tax=Salsipaludibacter albus TaxID=2849650 RepID=UPI001EE498B4|nr:type II toxin-antitoxin system RelE/ParE family toxin [Salsipaludibacter albus]MBY5163698.1 type II toxin-antitoxin system RelE/ParE family toxin [Salsipaludibacter albus]
MATVELAKTAVEDLDRLIATHSLPADTRRRVRVTLAPLVEFPRLGPELAGRWNGMRFVLGPWRWMIIVCTHDESSDRVVVVSIHDARSSRSPTMR